MSSRRALRLVCFACGSVIIGAAAAVVVGEVTLRLMGHRPWPAAEPDPRSPPVYQYDRELGWVNRPGTYVLPPCSRRTHAVTITILADGRRATSRDHAVRPTESLPGLVLVGGSYVQGWAISDEQTMAWQLQERLPYVEVINYGTGGYGTYQSLLRLERHWARSQSPTALVLYGFWDGHEARNVAHPLWQILLARHARLGHVYVPYCTIGAAGRLVRHRPQACPAWPLLRRSALVAAVHRTWWQLNCPQRWRAARQVTQELLLELARSCRQHGCELLVLMLQCREPARRDYAEFMAANGIRYLDCTPDWGPEPKRMRVPGDGHPNGLINRLWAMRVADCIGPRLAAASGSLRPQPPARDTRHTIRR